ncbi:MAG: cbb3-type cytochrome c oxidase subunit I [Gammaproteobacteria bacterium]|nr:cbb3-type cytochrome c oxidase subunit I [Gammaproteobacteria bacterium]
MNGISDPAGESAHSSSDPWALDLPEAHLPGARRWLLLGLVALGGAGLFAVLLVLSRIPGAEGWLPGIDLFRVALVVHVDLSVLVWFLAFAGFLWTLRDGPRDAWGRRAFALAAAGTAFVVATPFTGTGQPVLSNYVPVLTSPLFLGGLALFALGISLRAFMCLQGGLETAHRTPVSAGLFLAAAGTVLAAFTLLRTGMKMPVLANPALRYEVLFWPAGHVLQFAYTALLLSAWLWLAAGTGQRPVGGPRVATMLLLSGILPLFGVPVVEMMSVAGSAEQRMNYTLLMRWGGLWPTVPVGLMVLLGLFTGPRAAPEHRPARSALYGSLLLFAVGGGLGWMISGLNTVIPAHYHGSIVGVTLALMGLTYLLLPRLGYRPVTGRLARAQPWVYAGGQLVHIAGLTWSGTLGVQRKTAGVEQALDSSEKMAAMGLSGLGGLLAIVGGLLFLVVCWQAMRRDR